MTHNTREVRRYPIEFMYVDENGDYQLIPHINDWLHHQLQKDREAIRTVLRELVSSIKANGANLSNDPERCDEYISRKKVLTLIDQTLSPNNDTI